jgi:transcriptional regulator with GAF, ATPase, and Fis domain
MPRSGTSDTATEIGHLLSELSTRFINLPAKSVDGEILSALRRVGECLDLDRVLVSEFGADRQSLITRHSWASPGVEPIRTGRIVKAALPRVFAELERGRSVRIPDTRVLAEDPVSAREWEVDLDEFRRSGAIGHLSIPCAVGGEPVGGFHVVRIRGPVAWSDLLVEQLALLAQVFANALHRRETERRLRSALSRVEELRERLEGDRGDFGNEAEAEYESSEIVGNSPGIEHALAIVDQVAPTDATVLILGETGTGKELVARAVHRLSKRAERPLVRVNCAALPDSLAESELFGHEKGAFTGALNRRIGRFELAHRGTLFLDEVGDLSPELQAKILRVLQEGEFERLGSSETHTTDVRVVAATSRDLRTQVDVGRFRADLFYRLSVVPIEVPPLRNRRQDIPALAWHFIEKARSRHAGAIDDIPADTLQALVDYDWPGNVRELANVIERAAILSPGRQLVVHDPLIGAPAPKTGPPNAGLRPTHLAAIERSHILRVLDACNWRVKGPGNAAELLGLNPSTLRGRMRKLGIARPA